MPIETNNLVIYKSERLTDTTDGGGKYSGQQLIDGQSNNLFKDISELDRTMGDVSMRKIFPAVTTNDTDVLMGATVFISELPQDPNVSAALFSTKDWTDERQSAQNRVESYLAKGGQAVGLPLDTHWKGMKILQTVMFPSETELSVGNSFVIISNEGESLEFEQYVRITKVETRIAIMIIDEKEVEYKIATYNLSDPLLIDFVGLSAKQWYFGEKSTSILRETLVADTGNYYSSSPVVEDVNVGTYTVNAKSMFTQLIPAAQSETPIVDVNANSENMTLIAGNNGIISASYPTNIGENQNLYLASSVIPGTVAFTLFNQSITDQGGILKNNNGIQVGTIDYQRGLIRWTQSAGTGNANLNISFKPASAPTQPYNSYALPVTQNNQSANWTGVITPIPAPGSLTISYMAQGKFYVLRDDGSGMLTGVSSSFGSGTISYETGSWLLTTGALPDVDTPILLLWGTPITTFIRSNLAVQPAAFEFDLGTPENNLQNAWVSGLTVKWLLEGVEKTATTSGNKFTGDATGTFNPFNNTGRLVPNKLPQKGTVFNFEFNISSSSAAEITNVVPDSANKLTFSLPSGTKRPGSITLSIPLTAENGLEREYLDVFDVQINSTTGNLVDSNGTVFGTVDYSTNQVVITPTLMTKQFIQIYVPNQYETTVYASA